MKAFSRKLKKLLFNPADFFIDIFLYKFHLAEDYRRTENLFIISQLGQLTQYQELIKQQQRQNNVLIVLYTKKNHVMPHLIANKADASLFNSIRLLCLPSSPMRINAKNYMIMRNSYKYLINRIRPKNLFISSFEKHYALLARYALSRKIPVHLVEEGTGTYRYNSEQQANAEIAKNLNKHEKKQLLKINLLPIYQSLRGCDNIFNQFSSIYVAYPELVKDVFHCQNIQPFSVYNNIEFSPQLFAFIQAHKFSSQDILFLAQRYSINEQAYIDTLLEILQGYAEKYQTRIFIKLHPKEREQTKATYQQKIGKAQNMHLLTDNLFSAEELIAKTQPQRVIALTSTGLIYTKLISKRTQAISIYPLFKQMITDKLADLTELNEVESHYAILAKFPSIYHIRQRHDL